VSRPKLVLVGTGTQTYREYLLRAAAAEFDLWLFTDRELGWEAPHVAGHTRLDTADVDAMTVPAKVLAPDGVLTWDDTRVVQAAALATALGLPTSPPGAVLRCRDKHRTRTALHEAGVPQARSRLVDSLVQARAAADEIGYPLVLKPRALNASIGVVHVEGPQLLAARFRIACGATLPGVTEVATGVLVEEYLDGPEISVDTAWLGGRMAVAFVARKQLGFPPSFEEIGHIVDGRDPLLADERLRDVLEAAHRAVGFDTGWTHTELRLTTSGPRIVEINARVGGDRIPDIGQLATGIDAAGVAAAIACGRKPVVRPTRRRVAAVRFLYPPHDLIARAVRIDRDQLPPQISSAEPIAMPGQELRLPPNGNVTSRYALLTAIAATHDECHAALDAATAAVHLDALRRLRL
jgi:biotin carboxylase